MHGIGSIGLHLLGSFVIIYEFDETVWITFSWHCTMLRYFCVREEYYEDSFVSEDGNTRGSVKVSKDGRTVSSSSRSSVSGKGGSASVSVSSSSVSSSGARAHGRSAATTKVDGESKWQRVVGAPVCIVSPAIVSDFHLLVDIYTHDHVVFSWLRCYLG